MRFKHYINEGNTEIELKDINEFNDMLHKKCKPYLKLIKSFKEPLNRGIYTNADMGIKKVRKDRSPLGTSEDDFIKINNWLDENGHNRRDNTFMCTGIITSSAFGFLNWVFPVGKFSYTWIKANDFNEDDSKTGWKDSWITHRDIDDDDHFASYFVTDKNLKIAFKNNYEIWIKCKEYMFADKRFKYNWNNKKQIIEKNNET